MTHRWTTWYASLAVLATATGLLSACSGGGRSASSPPTSPAATTRAKATPKPKPKPKPVAKPKPYVNPLRGTSRHGAGPVIAVKIDDTPPGRPPLGLDRADIVYIEQAEAGLSRLVGVFNTYQPTVGYVRSVRSSDPELLSQYGRIVLGASGGGGDSLPTLDASIVRGWIQDRNAGFYARDYSRASDYINVTLNLAAVARSVRTGTEKSIGYTWSPSPPRLAARPRAGAVNTRVGTTPVRFRWSPGLKKYVRYIDGAAQRAVDGGLIATPNVIVQHCTISVHPQDVDVNGSPAMYTHSVGRGRVTVFRDGRRIEGLWSRPNSASGTTMRDGSGRVIPLAPGGAWVVLVATGVPVTTG